MPSSKALHEAQCAPAKADEQHAAFQQRLISSSHSALQQRLIRSEWEIGRHCAGLSSRCLRCRGNLQVTINCKSSGSSANLCATEHLVLAIFVVLSSFFDKGAGFLLEPF